MVEEKTQNFGRIGNAIVNPEVQAGYSRLRAQDITLEVLIELGRHAQTRGIAAVIIDPRDKIVWGNNTFYKILGYPENEVVGRQYTDFMPWSPEKVKTFFRNPDEQTVFVEVKQKDGTTEEMELEKNPIMHRGNRHLFTYAELRPCGLAWLAKHFSEDGNALREYLRKAVEEEKKRLKEEVLKSVGIPNT